MRRTAFLGALILSLCWTASAVGQTSAGKIGYVNSQIILEQAPGARAANEQFNRDLESMRSEVQRMGDEIQQMIQQYEQQQLTLSPDAKASREQAIMTRQGEYQARAEALEEQAGLRQQELVQPVMDRITRVIEDIRAEGGYALIFDVATGAIVSADPNLDLTDEVIRRLQAQGAPGDDGAG